MAYASKAQKRAEQSTGASQSETVSPGVTLMKMNNSMPKLNGSLDGGHKIDTKQTLRGSLGKGVKAGPGGGLKGSLTKGGGKKGF